MPEPRNILVIGCGPAGVWAAISAKKQDPAAAVTLLSNEAGEPYEKPPLSKGVLTGKSRVEDALIAGPKGLAGHGVTLRSRATCVAIDRAAKAVTLADGSRLSYDALVIATGSVVRQLPMFPAGMPGVHYLRTEQDAHALRRALGNATVVCIIGAGLIGLEVAASARHLGIDVTVLEVAPRILARVTDPDTGARIHAAHARNGVDIRLDTTITGAKSEPGGSVEITTMAGILHADALEILVELLRPERWHRAVAVAAARGVAARHRAVILRVTPVLQPHRSVGAAKARHVARGENRRI